MGRLVIGPRIVTMAWPTRALTIANSTGNQESGAENAAGQLFIGPRSITSLVYSNEFTDKLTYVFQGDFG